MKWCHTHPESFCISCHPYNLIESCHHSVKDWTRSAKSTFSRDSYMFVLLTPRNELQLKTTWQRQAGWGLLNGQWWKRPNVPVRTRGDWNYFIQDGLFIIHNSHFYSFILNAGGVRMGEGNLCMRTSGKGKKSLRSKLREWGVSLLAPLLNLFKLYNYIGFSFLPHYAFWLLFGYEIFILKTNNEVTLHFNSKRLKICLGHIEDTSTQETLFSLALSLNRLYSGKFERQIASPAHESRMSISNHTPARLCGMTVRERGRKITQY